MTCGWISRRLDRYRECALGLTETLLVRWHLARCAKCHAQNEREETVGSLLAALPVAAPPSSLELRILSALSVEVLMRDRPLMSWRRRQVRFGNWLRPITVPVLGGLLMALILVPMLLSAVWMEPVAHADDVPLRFLASPVMSAPMMTLPSPYPVADEIAVVAYIDAHGGVYDYMIVTQGPLESRAHRQLANTLLTSKFRPATLFGQPIPSSRVILFQSVESAA